MKTLTAIDLFAGIGGIRFGFEKAGFQIIFANDSDPRAALVYQANHGEIDSRPLETIDIKELPSKFDVLLAGFPCQPFSKAGKKRGFQDTRGTLFFELAKILDSAKPQAFFFENVKHLLTHDSGRTFSRMLTILKCELGYEVFVKTLNSKNFGLPQNRERLYIVGFKDSSASFDFDGLRKYRPRMLNTILETRASPEYYLSEKYFTGLMRHKARHTKLGNGFGCQILDPHKIANTLLAGNMGREHNLIRDRRLTKKEIAAFPRGKPNNEGIRKLTVNECKSLQGFSKRFKMPVSNEQAYKLLGNSVSIPVIYEIAKQMREVLFRSR